MTDPTGGYQNLTVPDNTPQEKKKTVRVVCGSNVVRGPKDAMLILNYLGLNPNEGVSNA